MSCTAIFAPLYQLFGAILKFFYDISHNYGVAIMLFTLAVNIILLPLTWKQQKSTTKMQSIQPELERLQQKYKNDKEKLNMEMMKLYQNNNINPMSGCLPLLIQLPIIFILYQIVQKPVTYILGQPTNMANELSLAVEKGMNFNLLGLNLGAFPNQVHGLLLIIPVLAGVTTYALTWLTMRQAEARKTEAQKRKESDNPTANSMQTMNKIMPLITAFIAYTFPAGLGFYWIMNNIFKMVQQVAVNKILAKEDPLVIEQTSGNKKKKKK